jgi:hypothetical protein
VNLLREIKKPSPSIHESSRLSSLTFTFHPRPIGPAKLSFATGATFFLAFIHDVVQLLKEVDKLLLAALFASCFRQFSPVICNQGMGHRCSSFRAFVISQPLQLACQRDNGWIFKKI